MLIVKILMLSWKKYKLYKKHRFYQRSPPTNQPKHSPKISFLLKYNYLILEKLYIWNTVIDFGFSTSSQDDLSFKMSLCDCDVWKSVIE